MKLCSKCGLQKQEQEFCICSKSKDGLQSQCKECKKKGISQYYINNPGRRSRRTKQQNRERYYKNKINYNIARRIRRSLHGESKTNRWEALVGFSLFELKGHLEKKFYSEMSWNNYGYYWDIDHVVPISRFKIKSHTDSAFKKCWMLSNLQPLLKKDNRVKSNK